MPRALLDSSAMRPGTGVVAFYDVAMPNLLIGVLTASDWITAGTIAALTILAALFVRRFTKRRIRKVDTLAELVDVTGRLVMVVLVALGAYYTMRALDIQIGPLLGALGIGALFIAVGLQPLLINVVGSVILQTRRPFRRGDQIKSSGFEGTVIDITSTSTVLLSYNGEAIHIPNATILSEPLINWTHEPVRRTILPITLPYGCELPMVLRGLGKAARNILDDSNLPPAEALTTGFGDHGIDVELRFWHYSDELESRVALSQVSVAIDTFLNSIDVSVPYPQLVMHRPNVNRTGAQPQSD